MWRGVFLDVLNLGLQGRDVQKSMKIVSTFALTVDLPLLVRGGACQNMLPFPSFFFLVRLLGFWRETEQHVLLVELVPQIAYSWPVWAGRWMKVVAFLAGQVFAWETCALISWRFFARKGGALNESRSISGRVVDAFHNLDCILPLLMRRGFFFVLLILGPCGRGIVHIIVLHHVSILTCSSQYGLFQVSSSA